MAQAEVYGILWHQSYQRTTTPKDFSNEVKLQLERTPDNLLQHWISKYRPAVPSGTIFFISNHTITFIYQTINIMARAGKSAGTKKEPRLGKEREQKSFRDQAGKTSIEKGIFWTIMGKQKIFCPSNFSIPILAVPGWRLIIWIKIRCRQALLEKNQVKDSKKMAVILRPGKIVFRDRKFSRSRMINQAVKKNHHSAENQISKKRILPGHNKSTSIFHP